MRPLVSVFFALFVLGAAGLVMVTGAIVDRSRAQLAADAAALAGAAEGEAAARQVAATNGGSVVAFDVDDVGFFRREVKVRVTHGGAEVVATAERYPEGGQP